MNLFRWFVSHEDVHYRRLRESVELVKELVHYYGERVMSQVDDVVASLAESKATVDAVAVEVAKIGTETSASLAKITELEAIIAGSVVGVDPAIVQAVADLKASLGAMQAGVAAVDDLVPDAA